MKTKRTIEQRRAIACVDAECSMTTVAEHLDALPPEEIETLARLAAADCGNVGCWCPDHVAFESFASQDRIARLCRAARDAERYRFLRDNPLQLCAIDGNASFGGYVKWGAAHFDEFTDVAMADAARASTSPTETDDAKD
jgi:hypothetical protein